MSSNDSLSAQISSIHSAFESKLSPANTTTIADDGSQVQYKDVSVAALEEYVGALGKLFREMEPIPSEWPQLIGTHRAQCDYLIVDGDLTLQDCTAPGISLVGTIFLGTVRFNGARFLGEIDFHGAKFHKETNFSGARFLRAANFSKSQFFEKVSFSTAQFMSRAQFDGAQFELDADFAGCSYSGDATFRNSVFKSEAVFSASRFMGHTSFRNSQFKRHVDFKRCRFLKTANFSGKANEANRVEEEFDASYAVFSTGADFSNRAFGKTTDFSAARFGNAPLFYDSTLSHDTRFTATDFSIPAVVESMTARVRAAISTWKKVPNRSVQMLPAIARETWEAANSLAMSNKNAYRALKHLFGAMKAQQEEGLFFALEQRAARYSISFWRFPFQKALSWAYDVVSGYGENPGKAFCLWWLWSVLFFFLYTALANLTSPIVMVSAYCDAAVCSKSLLAAYPNFGLAAQSALNPFALVSEKPLLVVPAMRWGVFLLSGIQGLGSVSIFTLFLLAVRRKFHKGSE